MSDTQLLAPSIPDAAPATPHRLGFWRAVGIIAGLELRQRTRSLTWWILLAVWFLVIGLVTTFTWWATVSSAAAYGAGANGGAMYSVIIFFVLLFGSLIAPAISGNAINSERNAATLATTQVTLVGHWPIMTGKFLAAWGTGMAFLVVATPFIAWALLLGGVDLLTFFFSLIALALQLGILTMIGVGLSAVIQSPLFSIVVTYLVVAFLSIGTLIFFGLAGAVTMQFREVSYGYADWSEYDECWSDGTCDMDTPPAECTQWDPPTTQTYNRWDYYWWVLAANPYVIVADFSPTTVDENGYPSDVFGWIKQGARMTQIPPDIPEDGAKICQENYDYESLSYQQVMDSTIPTWWMGFGLQAAGATWAFVGGAHRIKTPAKKLPKGSRIA